MNKTITYRQGASLPDLPLVWRDRDGVVLPLAASTITCKIGQVGAAALVLVTTVQGFNTVPNVLVQFGPTDLNIPVGNYQLAVEEADPFGRTRIETWPLIIEPVVN